MKKSATLMLLLIYGVGASLSVSQAALGDEKLKSVNQPWSEWSKTHDSWVKTHPERAQYFNAHPADAETYRHEWWTDSAGSSSVNRDFSHGEHVGEHHGEEHHGEHHDDKHHDEHHGDEHHGEHHGDEHHGGEHKGGEHKGGEHKGGHKGGGHHGGHKK